MLILPNNSALSDAVLTNIESYVATGGRLMAHHYIDGRTQSLLGVSLAGFTQGASGQFTSFHFSDTTIPNLPSMITQNSWGVIQAGLGNSARHPRIIANWNDYNSIPGPAAWIASDNGLYMSHVLLDDDPDTKAGMLLSLISYYVPEVLSEAAAAAINDIGRVGQYTQYADAVTGIRANESQLPATRVANVENALNSAETHRNAAFQALNAGQAEQVLSEAKQARLSLQQAYILGQVAGAADEFRAVWSHEGVGPYPGNWTSAINLLADSGFNAIFPNIASAGFADYTSINLPGSKNLEDYGDQLSAVLAPAHAAGIEVTRGSPCGRCKVHRVRR